jgi:predicted phosphodiesterase
VIGDIHCEDRALEVSLAKLHEMGVDAVLTVGDIVDGFGDVDRTIALLVAHDVIAVRGNHERWFLANEMRQLGDATHEVTDATRAWLETLPPTRELETARGKLLLCHGVGDDDMAVLTPDSRGYGLQTALEPIRNRTDLALVVGGHTHQRMVRNLGPFTFINAGTLHRDFPASFGLVDLVEGRVTFFELDHDQNVVGSESFTL